MPDQLPTVQSDIGPIEPIPVVLIAQDGSPLIPGVAVGPTTGSVTSIASSATVVTISGANATRKGLTVFNESTSVLYLKLGASASNTSYTLQIPAGGYWELPFNYTGAISGVWATANGFARVTTLA